MVSWYRLQGVCAAQITDCLQVLIPSCQDWVASVDTWGEAVYRPYRHTPVVSRMTRSRATCRLLWLQGGKHMDSKLTVLHIFILHLALTKLLYYYISVGLYQ